MLPKQILVADNDLSALGSVAYLLQSAGYSVFVAESPEAFREQLAIHVVHACIIDMRLTDNQHVEDVSGFSVARELPEDIPFIIYTAYQDIVNLRQALSDVGAADMVDKKVPDAPEQLLEAVDKLFTESVPVNFDLEIHGNISTEDISDGIKLPDSSLTNPSSEDIRQILCKIFERAKSILIEPLFGENRDWLDGRSRSVLLYVRPQYEDGGFGTPMVVKFGAVAQIHQEAENYALLLRFIGGTRLTILEQTSYAREIGALCYRLFGPTDLQPIAHFCDLFTDSSMPVTEIASLVRNFFDEAFTSIYEQAESETIDLFAHYASLLELDIAEMRQMVNEFFRECDGVTPSIEDQTAYWHQLDCTLPNPMLWLTPDRQWRSMPVQTKVCLCHGDMHSHNLLVDSAPSLWLIDFERVATCHWLRDYVELETDIKFQLGLQLSLPEFLAVEEGLLEGKTVDVLRQKGEDASPTSSYGVAAQAYRFIELLRSDAKQRFGLPDDMTEYYAALLINTLYVMQLRSTSTIVMEQAYLSASLLCSELQAAS